MQPWPHHITLLQPMEWRACPPDGDNAPYSTVVPDHIERHTEDNVYVVYVSKHEYYYADELFRPLNNSLKFCEEVVLYACVNSSEGAYERVATFDLSSRFSAYNLIHLIRGSALFADGGKYKLLAKDPQVPAPGNLDDSEDTRLYGQLIDLHTLARLHEHHHPEDLHQRWNDLRDDAVLDTIPRL